MEGAAAATRPESGRAAAATGGLLVGLDFAVRERFLRIVGDPPAGTEHDRLAEMLGAHATPVLGQVLAAAWRAALAAIADGAEPQDARAAIAALGLDLPDGE